MKNNLFCFLLLIQLSCVSDNRQKDSKPSDLSSLDDKKESRFISPITPIDTANNIEDSTLVFKEVEQWPEFPGGENACNAFIKSRLDFYVKGKLDTTGRVTIRLFITREGKVTSPKVIHSLSPKLDKIALRIVSDMPDFIPGKQNDVRVNVYYIIPITFK